MWRRRGGPGVWLWWGRAWSPGAGGAAASGAAGIGFGRGDRGPGPGGPGAFAGAAPRGGASLRRNMLVMGSGTAGAQGVLLLFAPLLTRIYGPEALGLQGLFLSLVSILSPVIGLRYPMGIVLAPEDTEAERLGRLALCLALGLGAALCAVLAVAQAGILRLLGAEALGGLIWFLPVALVAIAFQEVAEFRAARRGAFGAIGLASLVQAVCANLARALGGIAAPVAGILVAVTSLAPAVLAAQLSFGAPRARGGGFRKGGARGGQGRPAQAASVAAACVEIRVGTGAAKGYFGEDAGKPPGAGSAAQPVGRGQDSLCGLLIRYRALALYRMPNDVLNAVSQSVPVLLLGMLYSPAAAGFYTLSRSVMTLPAVLFGRALGHVLLARFAELDRAGARLLPLLLRALGGLLALAPAVLLLGWFAPQVFAFAFGEGWREAGEYARWLSLWLVSLLLAVPASRVMPVIGRQRAALVSTLLLLAARVLTLLIVAHQSGSAVAAVAWFAAVSTVLNLAGLLLVLRLVAGFDRARRGLAHG